MIRCSCQGLHGCVPVAPSAMPERVRKRAGAGRGARPCRAAASANVSQRPVRISTSDAISSPTRWPRAPSPARLPEVLEAVDEPERRRVEERELLLDRDRQVLGFLELLPGEARAARPALRRCASPIRAESIRAKVCGAMRSQLQRATAARRAPPGECALGGGQGQDRARASPARSATSPAGEAGERAELGRVLGLEALRRSRRGPECRATSGGDPHAAASGGDHPERLREDGRRRR